MTFPMHLTEYVSKKLRDDNGDFSVWGKALLEHYIKVGNASFIPPVSWRNGREFILLGARGVRRAR